MASFVASGSRLSLRVVVGTKPDGAQDLKSASWRGVNAAATADAVEATAAALAAVMDYPRKDTTKTDLNLVTA